MDRVFHSWAGLASHFIGECFDLASPYIDNAYEGLDPLVRFVSAQLFIDCHLSSESVLLLVRDGKEWDSDLVGRSVMEGTLKFAYMLQGSSYSVREKVDEYWNVLPQYASIRHSERAKRLLKDVGDPSDGKWRPFHDLILTDDEVTLARGHSNRKERNQLEERWSFNGICKELAESGDPWLSHFIHFAHGYGMSSHLVHKDADGVGMVWERYKRDSARQTAAKLGHLARVVSDICAFAQLRLIVLLRACGEDTEKVNEIEGRYQDALFTELSKAGRRFTNIEYADEMKSGGV